MHQNNEDSKSHHHRQGGKTLMRLSQRQPRFRPAGLLAAPLLAILLVVLSCSPASAKQVYGPVTAVIGQGEEGHTGGSANGELAGPSGVAIDQSTGDVYVVDKGNNRVERYEASGGYLSQFNGGPGHTLSEPSAVAVDQNTGDVYVADTGHNAVDKFTPAGAYICQLTGVGRGCQANPTEPPTFSAPAGVAVDPTSGSPTSGDLYISDTQNAVVDVFTATGADVTQFQPGEEPLGLGVDSAGNVFVAVSFSGRVQEYSPGGAAELLRIRGIAARAVGVDLQSGDFFVGAEPAEAYRMIQFGPSGSELESFGLGAISNPGFTSPGIAVNSASHAVYAADTGTNIVDVFGLVKLPDPAGCAATTITSTSATLIGTVNPRDTRAESLFQYGGTSEYGLETGLSLVGGGAEVEAEVPVEATVTALTPGTLYHCRIDAINGVGQFNDGQDGTFETPPLPPAVDEPPAFATEVTANSAILNGVVNPGNAFTTYHFAYGLHAHAYTQSLPEIGIGTGLTPVSVEQALSKGTLAPNTTYHFALIATNPAPAGTVTGTDEEFTTAPANPQPETPPTATTGAAESITQNTATLTGTIDPKGAPTEYRFELGTTPAYGTVLYGGRREAGAVGVTQPLGNLQPGVTYHYRVVASNLAGTAVGEDQTFTTAIYATPIAPGVPPPLLSTPNIAFPQEPRAMGSTKHLTRAQLLVRALRACKKKPEKQRTECARKARKAYGKKK